MEQSWGSGTGCFWGLLDPDPLVRDTDPAAALSIIKQNSKKNLDSYCFVTSFTFFLENDVIRNKNLNKTSFLLASGRSRSKIAGSGSVGQRHGSADQDPYQNVADPQHCFEINNYRYQYDTK